uniref:Centrosomal protein of 162 kDa n=1 Tax=Meleagris gallopavo TaxID=9103 RepID=G1NLT5_MELGA
MQLTQSLSDDSPGNSEKKSSILETLGELRKKETKQKDAVPWWLCEEDLDDGEILEASESIVKKALQLSGESDENMHPEKMQLQKSNGVAFSLSRDSLETNDSFVASVPNQSNTGVGLDTLEEQEEKEIFFAKLEQEASSPIDYSRLNKELNSSDSVMLAPFQRFFLLPKWKALFSLNSPSQLLKQTVVCYFPIRKSYSICYETAFSTGTLHGQTTSDTEALHRAYRHINQSLGDTDEQKIRDSSMAISKCLVQVTSQNHDLCSKNTSTTESGKYFNGKHIFFVSPVKSCERELRLLRRAQIAEEDLNSARDLIQQLTSTVSEKEKEMETKIVELKTRYEKELSQLGQENYVLQSKLRSVEELSKEKRWIHHTAPVPVSEEKLSQIRKEMEDQEVIIQGYQQENERLYKQMKELQIQNKKNEEQMFKENQCLMSELIALREKIERTTTQSQIVQESESTRNQSFTELISELRAARKEETKLREEVKRLKQDKQALELDLGQAKKERDLAKSFILVGEKSYEFKVMEESYKQEILHLKRRLHWYAENQDLLDKDAARLKDAREEIEKLKQEVEKLRAEAGDHQCVQQKKRLRDRAADARRIQDLERQIKEMEGILKRRYPNSLPALIYAAASAEKTDELSAKTNTIDFLERRIKKLETELEGKDDEAKTSLRAMEQQFQKIKMQYEQRLVELEQLLAYKWKSESPKLNSDKANSVELELQLQNLKRTHQITVENLQTEIENLKSQNSQLKLRSKKDNKDLQSTDWQVKQGNTKEKLLKLNQELITKNREIQDLTKTVEKLQKERMAMLSDNNLRNKTDNKENCQEILKKNIVATEKRNSINSEPSVGIFNNDKMYQPRTFSDSNVLEVLQENTRLKEELEKLSLEMNQQRVKSQATLAYSENNIRRIQEDTAEYVAALKASHQREVEKILSQYTKEHSASKVAELNGRISTQEILIKHLQEQISEHQRHQEALLVSQMREEFLQKEVAKLLEELREAKESQSPEMKHFLCLEKKIKHIETRHAVREQELLKATQPTQHITEGRQSCEAERWRKLAQRKNEELERFRVELDSILDVLRELQKQGVVIPNTPEHF